jgi:N-acetylneuraminic acid mutarotase
MKGDFSRFSFDPRRHYSRVLLQQGRVQTDSDWNEQGDIAAYQRDTSLRDVIGPIGVPRDQAGFAIRGLCGRRFDGLKSAIEVRADFPLLFNGNDYAIEGWIKIEGEKRRATIASRFDHEWTGEFAGGFRFGISHGRLRFERLVLRDERIEQIEIVTDAWGGSVEEDIIVEVENRAWVRIVGNRALPVDRFCHVAAVCEGGWIRLFVDGVLDAERYGGDGAPFLSTPTFIGCHPARHGLAHHFQGVIDQLRIWRHGLDEKGVRAARNGRISRNDSNLAFHWRFDGAHGAAGNADHMPRPAEPEIWIGAGRCYVDGVLCENETDIRYDEQPDCPGLALPDRAAHAGPYLAYLDSWDRVVSAIEDETILEPALGGPDTAVRLRTVCQVRLLPLPEGAEPVLPTPPPPGRLQMSPAQGLLYEDNSLVRIEIHDPGVAAGAPPSHRGDTGPGFEVVSIDALRNTITIAQSRTDPRLWGRGQVVELVRAGSHNALTATIVRVEAATEHCILQLSNVPQNESHPTRWRLRPIATFKWSRDNGAWAFSIASVDWKAGSTQMIVKVTDPNRMRNVLSADDWVELIDNDLTLLGQGGPLFRIGAMPEGDRDGFTIVLDHVGPDPLRPFSGRPGSPAMLRGWQAAPGALGVRPITAGECVELDGVVLKFDPGHYASGDYWVAPLRQRVHWPMDRNDTPLALPPQGIKHRRAPLALVWFKEASIEVKDLRPVFAPITEDVVTSATSSMPDNLAELERDTVEDASVMGNVGVVPPDHCILGPSEQPPVGWRYTGVQFAKRNDDAAWIELEPPLPEAGPALAAALKGNIFCLWESGDFFAIDPRKMHARTACRKPERIRFAGASMVALDGKLHVLGGFGPDGNASGAHCQYDPATDTWRELAPLPTPRGMIATAALGGSLIAIGGSPTQEPRPVNLVDRYLAASDSWAEWPSLPHGRCGAAASAQGGRLYLFGGYARCLFGLRSRATNKVLVFSPRTERWSETSPLATARSGAQVVRADRRLYVVGGRRIDDGIAPIEVFDAMNGNWLEVPQPAVGRKESGVTMLNGAIYLLGGVSAAGFTATIETFAAEQVFYIHSKLLTPAE